MNRSRACVFSILDLISLERGGVLALLSMIMPFCRGKVRGAL